MKYQERNRWSGSGGICLEIAGSLIADSRAYRARLASRSASSISAEPCTSTIGGSERPLPVGSENISDTSGLAPASSAFFGYPRPVVTSMQGPPIV